MAARRSSSISTLPAPRTDVPSARPSGVGLASWPRGADDGLRCSMHSLTSAWQHCHLGGRRLAAALFIRTLIGIIMAHAQNRGASTLASGAVLVSWLCTEKIHAAAIITDISGNISVAIRGMRCI